MPTVELPGRGTLAYRWSGEGAETVVLVNGSVFNYHQWDMQALPILQRELGDRCRFLQYDYVGIGGSSAKTAPFNMQDLAEELRELLDALSVDQVHLLGVSKGSMVGQAFLFKYLERAKSFCGLGNPNAASDGWRTLNEPFRERLVALDEMKELWPQRIDRSNYERVFRAVYVPAIFFKQYAELSLGERVRAFLLKRMVYTALEGTYVQTMVDLFRYYVDGIYDETLAFTAGLKRIQGVPLLLLNGAADTTTPVELARELAQMLPGAELVEFEGITHMGPMMLKKQAEPVFGRYVVFLKEVLA
jgi:3-oxoadipate enol-lactonase